MAELNFVDYVKIYCRSGKLWCEEYIPNAAPTEVTEGPEGGHIILRRNYWTLLHLRTTAMHWPDTAPSFSCYNVCSCLL